MTAPLSSIRVLDLSRILAGPWASQMLADLGAQVIKVERPGQGDDTRHWGPPYLKGKDGDATCESAYYLSANRGKQSVTIDLSHKEGQKIIRDLALQSDVLIENYKVGGLKKYGLDYDNLSKLNPRLIYCSITGFGQTGPLASRAGYDFIIQAMGGLMSVTGERDELGGEPQKAGVALSDVLTGLYAAIGIQAALLEREKSGLGQYLDIALLDVQTACLANQAMNYLIGGEVPGRLGNAHPNIVPYQAFATSDGHLVLAVGNDVQFQQFCTVAGCPEMALDAQFARNDQRVAHREILCRRISELLATRTTADWLSVLTGAGVPCGPINSIDQVFSEPQIRARKMKQDIDHPLAGKLPVVGNPLNFSRTAIKIGRPPPLLGEHTEQILAKALNYSQQRIQALKGRGII